MYFRRLRTLADKYLAGAVLAQVLPYCRTKLTMHDDNNPHESLSFVTGMMIMDDELLVTWSVGMSLGKAV